MPVISDSSLTRHIALAVPRIGHRVRSLAGPQARGYDPAMAPGRNVQEIADERQCRRDTLGCPNIIVNEIFIEEFAPVAGPPGRPA